MYGVREAKKVEVIKYMYFQISAHCKPATALLVKVKMVKSDEYLQ